jgi:hypothetical protein
MMNDKVVANTNDVTSAHNDLMDGVLSAAELELVGGADGNGYPVQHW